MPRDELDEIPDALDLPRRVRQLADLDRFFREHGGVRATRWMRKETPGGAW